MGFLDFLSAAITPAQQYQTGRLQGAQEKRDREQSDYLTALKLAQQQQEAELNRRVKESQIKNYESLAADRDRVPEETFTGSPVELGAEPGREAGMYLRGSRGTMQRVGAAPTKPVTPHNIDPLSPEGIAAAAERARRIRAAAPPQGTTPRIPVSMVEKLGAYDAIEGMAGDVKRALEDAVRKNVNVTGRVGGVLKTPTWAKNLVGMGGDTGKDVRSLIGNLYATIAKERGGTALSTNELNLLESYLPNENEDEGTAVLKANRFIREIRRLKESKITALQKYGKFSFDDSVDAREDDLPYGGVELIRPPEE